MAKHTIIDLHKLAESRGGKCLSKKYIKSFSKYLWKCSNGHSWQAPLNNVKTGSWCPICNQQIYYTLDDMHKIAGEKGGKCLSDKYINIEQKLKWKCNHGHTFESTLRAIIHKKRWCKICAITERNKSYFKALKDLAESKGGKLLSKEYIRSIHKLLWQCEHGHEWAATSSSIKNNKNWCPVCSGHKANIHAKCIFHGTSKYICVYSSGLKFLKENDIDLNLLKKADVLFDNKSEKFYIKRNIDGLSNIFSGGKYRARISLSKIDNNIKKGAVTSDNYYFGLATIRIRY